MLRSKVSENAGTVGAPEYVSVWLYVAGLFVTLSGLYAVNFGLDEPNFGLLTYGLAVAGYTVSYVLRVNRISLQTLQVPLIVCLGLIFFAGLTSDQGLTWFAPQSVIEDRAKSLQLIFVYMAIIHSFMLSTDAAVLFACVPCMTMLALVSTLTTDVQIQNAFLVFVAASTFLMVHENYLRTRHSTMLGKTRASERRLFGGQLQLAAFCVLGALVLANFVAVPIRAVGQTLFIPTAFSAMNSANKEKEHQATQKIEVKERSSIDLSGGPVSESDTPLLRVRCDRGLYWRGATFDFYTGRRFENRIVDTQQLEPQTNATQPQQDDGNFFSSTSGASSMDDKLFRIPASPFVLPKNLMNGSRSTEQVVSVQGGLTSQLYGAGEVQTVHGNFATLQSNASGAVIAPDRLAINSSYTVTSQVPDDDPADLRTKARGSIPDAIAERYLQTRADDGSENDKLRSLAQELTRGQKTEYDRAETIRQYIARVCKYNLNAPPTPIAADAVEYFLTVSHQGYCDKFAAAMTLLGRYAGIPTRLASGFLAGDHEADGTYLVREKHKHLWCEVFFPRIGWVPFDATDGSEDITQHLAATKQANTSFMKWMFSHGVLPPILALLVSGLLLYLLKTEVIDRLRFGGRRRGRMREIQNRPEANLEIYAAYTETCHALSRWGVAREPYVTPEEYASQIKGVAEESIPDLARPVTRITNLHTRFFYGPENATEDDARAAREAATEVKTLLSHARRFVPAVANAGE